MSPTSPTSTPEDYGPYEGLLYQNDYWPSIEAGNVAILDMAPQHAIGAYRKLCRWAAALPGIRYLPPDGHVRDTPLGQALIMQALGHEAPKTEPQAEPVEPGDLMVMLIEASTTATEADAVFHYRIAQAILTYFDQHLVVVYQQQ